MLTIFFSGNEIFKRFQEFIFYTIYCAISMFFKMFINILYCGNVKFETFVKYLLHTYPCMIFANNLLFFERSFIIELRALELVYVNECEDYFRCQKSTLTMHLII